MVLKDRFERFTTHFPALPEVIELACVLLREVADNGETWKIIELFFRELWGFGDDDCNN